MIKRMYFEAAFFKHDDQDAGPVIVDRLEVTHADQMRGELEINKAHMPDARKAPMATSTAWIYHSLVRNGHYGGQFVQFWTHDLIGFEPLEDEPVVPVDPTSEPSGSDSPSPSPTATSATGSTPTSTTG